MKYTTPEIVHHRRELVTALHGDRFAQGTGYLCKGGKYCCLGVAAELAMEPLGLVKSLRDEYDIRNVYEYRMPGGNGWIAFLEKDALEYYGLSDSNQSILMIANDNGLPFHIIADILECMPITDTEGNLFS